MAGELALVEKPPENLTMAERKYQWKAQYSRSFSYPSTYLSSNLLNINEIPLSTSIIEKNIFKPTWLSSVGSSIVALQPSDHSHHHFVFTVSLRDIILEEHYVSKLHFVWPQVSCHSGFPTRGSLVIIASYSDNAGEKQKFALRFSTPSEIENFITSLEDVFSNKLPKEPSPVTVTSPVSSQSEFIPPYRPDTSNIMTPIYPPEPKNIYNENQQESQSQTRDIVAVSESYGGTFPPSFTSLVSSCYAEIEQNVLPLAIVPEIPGPDLKSQIAKYMQDPSFLDMVSKVNEVIVELGGDFTI